MGVIKEVWSKQLPRLVQDSFGIGMYCVCWGGDNNPKLAGILIPKPIKVIVYITVDQWSDTMILNI